MCAAKPQEERDAQEKEKIATGYTKVATEQTDWQTKLRRWTGWMMQ